MANDFDFRPRINFPIDAFKGIPDRWGGAIDSLTEGIEKGQTAAAALKRKMALEAALGSFSKQYPDPTVQSLGPVMQADPGMAEKIIPELLRAKFHKDFDPKRTYQFPNVLDDQGRPIIARANTGTGEIEVQNDQTGEWERKGQSVRGFAPQFRNDPVSGALIRTDAGGGVRSVGSPGFSGISRNKPEDAMLRLRQTSPKLADNFDEILNDTNQKNNPLLKASIEGASAAGPLKSILKSEGKLRTQVGLQSLGFYLARMSGSNSQLSDREREVFEQPLGLIDKVVNKGYRVIKGDLSPKMKQDLFRLADIIERRSKSQGEKVISEQKRKARVTLGHFYSSGIDAAFPTFDNLVTSELDMASPQEVPVGGGWNDSKEARYQELLKKKGK